MKQKQNPKQKQNKEANRKKTHLGKKENTTVQILNYEVICS